ncbi:mCG1051101 [Mus musculus]|nr:mCG1051101 [Mus musculus]
MKTSPPSHPTHLVFLGYRLYPSPQRGHF